MVVWLALLLLVCTTCDPCNQYKYVQHRITLEQAEEARTIGHATLLTSDEVAVGRYLEALKREEAARTIASLGDIPPSMYFLRTDVHSAVTDSLLLHTLKGMPKGGLLHVHSRAGNNSAVFEKYHQDSRFFIRIDPQTERIEDTGFYPKNPPTGWVSASTVSVQRLVADTTMLGLDGGTLSSTELWKHLMRLFIVTGGFFNFDEVYRYSLDGWLQYVALEERLQYVELRTFFGNRYVLDSSQPNGQRIVDPSGAADADLVQRAVDAAVAEHPDKFVGVRVILQGSRGTGHDMVRSALQQAVHLHTQYPRLIAGVDLVGEEDKGHSLLYYLPELMGVLERNMSLYLHVGESTWPGDLPPDGTSMAPVDNLYDVVALNATRLAHAVALLKRPYLQDVVRQRGTAVSVCPLSNQLLGYVRDLRMHPAIGWGVNFVISHDDASYYGYVDVAYDWYAAALGFGLRINDMKRLLQNSFVYSALSPQSRGQGLHIFGVQWYDWIATTLPLACAHQPPHPPSFSFLAPPAVPDVGHPTLDVFGGYFDTQLCGTDNGTLPCRIEPSHARNTSTTAATCRCEYVTHHRLRCTLPTYSPTVGRSGYLFVQFVPGKRYVNTTLLVHYVTCGA